MLLALGATFGCTASSVSPNIQARSPALGLSSPAPVSQSSAASTRAPQEPGLNLRALRAPRGKLLLVVFCASWCEMCERSLTLLPEIRGAFPERLKTVGISIDESPHAFAKVAKKYGETTEILWDRRQSAAASLGLRALPSVLFIDETGVVIDALHGQAASDQRQLKHVVAQHFSQRLASTHAR